jgi:hypothetical protein
MIDRAEKKYCVGCFLANLQMARIAARDGFQDDTRLRRSIPRLFKVECNRIDQMNPITRLCQRERVHSCGSAHVEDCGGRRRQMARQNRLRANPLQFATID